MMCILLQGCVCVGVIAVCERVCRGVCVCVCVHKWCVYCCEGVCVCLHEGASECAVTGLISAEWIV